MSGTLHSVLYGAPLLNESKFGRVRTWLGFSVPDLAVIADNDGLCREEVEAVELVLVLENDPVVRVKKTYFFVSDSPD